MHLRAQWGLILRIGLIRLTNSLKYFPNTGFCLGKSFFVVSQLILQPHDSKDEGQNSELHQEPFFCNAL